MTHFDQLANILSPGPMRCYTRSIIDIEAQEIPSLTLDDYVLIAKSIDNLILGNEAEKDVIVDISNKNVLCFDFDIKNTSKDDFNAACDVYLSNVVISFGDEQEEPVKLDKELLSGLFMGVEVKVYQK